VKDASALPPPRPRVSFGDGPFGRVQNLFAWSVMVGLGLIVLLFALITGAADVAIAGALLYVLVVVFAGVRGWI